MEYQKTCYAIHQTIQLNLEQKKKQMMNHMECITLMVKLDLELQC